MAVQKYRSIERIVDNIGDKRNILIDIQLDTVNQQILAAIKFGVSQNKVI